LEDAHRADRRGRYVRRGIDLWPLGLWQVVAGESGLATAPGRPHRDHLCGGHAWRDRDAET
jgi:hypothetical protein